MKITFIKTNKGKRLKEEVKNRNRFNKSKKTDNKYVDNNRRINISNNSKMNVENNYPNSNHNKASMKNNHKINNEKIMEGLKIIFKKNQLVLITLALMLITASYMNYNNSNNELDISLAELGDAKLVSANIIENEVNTDEKQNEVNTNEINESQSNQNEINSNEVNQNLTKDSIENANEINTSSNENNINESSIVETASNSTAIKNETNPEQTTNMQNTNYFVQTRLERETMYSQMLETYEKILENENIPADQKSIASNEIKNINDRKNAVSIVENLIKTKGFEEVIILINDNNVNVVVKSSNNLTTEQVAQITNIISRELKSNIEDIHISTHN